MSRSARNKLSEIDRLESTADLLPALNQLHEFIQLMQGTLKRLGGGKNDFRVNNYTKRQSVTGKNV